MQKITATVVMEIPEDKVIISKADFEEYQALKDDDYWWTPKDLKDHYHHDINWFKEKVLFVPRYKKELSTEFGGCVHYSSNDPVDGEKYNGRYWSFEPGRFRKFMKEHFAEINQ
ncbi:DUF771 domain-containing protein [Companilactobacillus ginsenosidimutans]|uniref:DUF771 domain-containing protein n=1 Tax=Companilactobacillus ginsenosidimutans TaxID=1007676 RepID=A0A0H4QEF6_9LACO|nr:DUF771 domain-containing protein [Companilactobacillus ginsenosidimutans]AKP66322.1 hypothetical protein ABM34_01315 [Companilactobacillus ginsenosidimutans]